MPQEGFSTVENALFFQQQSRPDLFYKYQRTSFMFLSHNWQPEQNISEAGFVESAPGQEMSQRWSLEMERTVSSSSRCADHRNLSTSLRSKHFWQKTL
jgi:hypothetical protein